MTDVLRYLLLVLWAAAPGCAGLLVLYLSRTRSATEWQRAGKAWLAGTALVLGATAFSLLAAKVNGASELGMFLVGISGAVIVWTNGALKSIQR